MVNRDLDAPLRRGPGEHAERLRRPQRAAEPSGAARLARRAVRRSEGWSIKTDAPADHALGDVPAGERRPTPTAPRRRPGEPPALADEPHAARLRSDARLAARRHRRARPHHGRPAGRHGRATAAASTAWSTASSCPACSAPSTSPTPTCTSRSARRPRPAAGAVLHEQPVRRRPRRRAGDERRDVAGAADDAGARAADCTASLYQREPTRATGVAPRVAFVRGRDRAADEPAAGAGRRRRGSTATASTTPRPTASRASRRCRTSPATPGRAARTGPTPRSAGCSSPPTGGHAGNDLAHAAVRRWVAPRDVHVRIERHGRPRRRRRRRRRRPHRLQPPGHARPLALHNAQGRREGRAGSRSSRATRSTSSSTSRGDAEQRHVHLGAGDRRARRRRPETLPGSGTRNRSSPARRRRRRAAGRRGRSTRRCCC